METNTANGNRFESVFTPVAVFADGHVLEVEGAVPEHLARQVGKGGVAAVVDDHVVDNLLAVGPKLIHDSVRVGRTLFGDLVKIHHLFEQEVDTPRVVVFVHFAGSVKRRQATAAPAATWQN